MAVEGPIGVGKTSLARILAKELKARLVLEEPETNPFLADFYRDPRRFAFQTQLTFLVSRHRQQSELSQRTLFDDSVVSDYIFDKDRIFAHLTLEERDMKLYTRIADALSLDVSVPDLIIYLQSTPERLLKNIRIRDIEYERTISETYLQDLCETYNSFFFRWDRSPLLIVNSVHIDFVNDMAHRRRLLNLIKDMPVGTSYFNPEA